MQVLPVPIINLLPPLMIYFPVMAVIVIDRPLSALILNCQSLVAKKESFLNLLDLHNPDIVFGSESWLKPNI